MNTNPSYLPILDVTRGDIVESIHYGALAIVDVSGELQTSHGDPELVTFLRSSSKPFQALPFIELDGDLAFGLTEREIAIMCASHSGTDDHVAVIRSIQEKVGVKEENLLCGVHPALDKRTDERMSLQGEKPTPNRHNCSGKHTGMLAHARLQNFPIDDYLNPEHPVQKTMLAVFAAMCDLTPEQVVLGVDGCSAPVYGVPLRNAALAYARLCDPSDLVETGVQPVAGS
jgi:L-asparaginase II